MAVHFQFEKEKTPKFPMCGVVYVSAYHFSVAYRISANPQTILTGSIAKQKFFKKHFTCTRQLILFFFLKP